MPKQDTILRKQLTTFCWFCFLGFLVFVLYGRKRLIFTAKTYYMLLVRREPKEADLLNALLNRESTLDAFLAPLLYPCKLWAGRQKKKKSPHKALHQDHKESKHNKSSPKVHTSFLERWHWVLQSATNARKF